METPASLAIETSCRTGGAALGRGDELVAETSFQASARHAVQLVPRIAELLENASLRPANIDELYVSVGPGSFTGVRVGLTVARTMGQMMDSLRCVPVPAPLAIADQAAELSWDRLAVVLDARDDCVHVSEFVRSGGQIIPRSPGAVLEVEQFLDGLERPVTLTGEGLSYHNCTGSGISIAPPELHFPTAASVWRVGRRLAREGQFVEYNKLVPIYARPPEVLRAEADGQSGAANV